MMSPASRLYNVYDAILESNLPLDELSPSHASNPTCVFTLLSACNQEQGDDWFHRYVSESGEANTLIGRIHDGYLLRYPGLADFELTAMGTRIEGRPVPGVTASTIRHLLLDQVIPHALSLSGRWILHASAVSFRKDDCIAFVARSGSGKSTLASALVKSGCALLSDDGILLTVHGGETLCRAGYPGVRLWGDSAAELFGRNAATHEFAYDGDKKRIDLAANQLHWQRDPATLRAVYFPSAADGDDVRIVPMSARDAFMQLVGSSFSIQVEEPDAQIQTFERLARLTPKPIFFDLNYPRRWPMLSKVVETLLRHANALPRDA